MHFERLETRQLMASDFANRLDANACSAFEVGLIDAEVPVASFASSLPGKRDAFEDALVGPTPEVVLYGPSLGAPKIQGVVFGDGTVQRSNVKSIAIQFDSIVDIAPGAFILERKNGAVWESLASEVTIQVSTIAVNGGTRANLSFTGAGIAGGSLSDGNYRLTAVASNITKNGVQLDGDGNGNAGDNFVRGEASSENFFRRFGDLNGNRMVDSLDVDNFKLGNGTSQGDLQFNANIDFDGNGVVNILDLGRFRLRNGTELTF